MSLSQALNLIAAYKIKLDAFSSPEVTKFDFTNGFSIVYSGNKVWLMDFGCVMRFSEV